MSEEQLPDIVRISFNFQYAAAEARAELAKAGEEITKKSIITKMLEWALEDIEQNEALILFTDPVTGQEVDFLETSEF